MKKNWHSRVHFLFVNWTSWWVASGTRSVYQTNFATNIAAIQQVRNVYKSTSGRRKKTMQFQIDWSKVWRFFRWPLALLAIMSFVAVGYFAALPEPEVVYVDDNSTSAWIKWFFGYDSPQVPQQPAVPQSNVGYLSGWNWKGQKSANAPVKR